MLGGYETLDYRSDGLAGRLKGEGWTAGSYLGWKVAPDIRFDAAAAFSRLAHNGVAGAATGNFDGNRWLLASGLTGTYYVRAPLASTPLLQGGRLALPEDLQRHLPPERPWRSVPNWAASAAQPGSGPSADGAACRFEVCDRYYHGFVFSHFERKDLGLTWSSRFTVTREINDLNILSHWRRAL